MGQDRYGEDASADLPALCVGGLGFWVTNKRSLFLPIPNVNEQTAAE